MTWPFGDLKMFGYGAILADPPWRYEMYSAKGYEKAPEAQYPTMADGDLLRLPVGDLAQRDCLLFLWATFPRLPFAIELMAAWGFKYVTGGAWLKRTATGKLRWGPGYTLRTVCEPFLIGRCGDVQHHSTSITNLIDSLAREHSRKPPEARAIVEMMTPLSFRCELFATEPWPENDVWGNQSNKYSGAAA